MPDFSVSGPGPGEIFTGAKVTSLFQLASYFPCLASTHIGVVSHDHLNEHIARMKPTLPGLRVSQSVPGSGRRRCMYEPTPTAYALGPVR
jgi:hypothetical protein